MKKLVLIGMVVSLSACGAASTKYWKHKSIPSSQWNSDYRKCQRATDKHLGLNESYHADQNLTQYGEQMRLYKLGKKQNELIGDCMRRLGYTPI